ncbi:MAG TPA: DUF1223 domain-containing protein [Terracidiphilus sp.]|jgi:hypothetical protein|nr:DUF1223 domain-containing protein [Terracidiphilus sp.]
MASPKLLHRCAVAFAISGVLAWAVFACSASAQSPQPARDHARVPVLVELFTSEGCSDCPPADRLLEQLDAKQFVPGAQAIVLSEHVTYWNHLGWRDPFSLDEMDIRQKEYGERFNLDSVYTPQVVIDGAAQVVGNNAAGVTNAVEHAASTPKKPLTVTDVHWENGVVSFTVHGADSASRLLAVLAADATGPKIERGENAGRTLHHVAVVRAIKDFGSSAADGRALRLLGSSLAHDQASPRLVVFLVDRKSGHVTAVSEQILRR